MAFILGERAYKAIPQRTQVSGSKQTPCTLVYTHARTHTHAHTHTCTQKHTRMYTHTHTRTWGAGEGVLSSTLRGSGHEAEDALSVESGYGGGGAGLMAGVGGMAGHRLPGMHGHTGSNMDYAQVWTRYELGMDKVWTGMHGHTGSNMDNAQVWTRCGLCTVIRVYRHAQVCTGMHRYGLGTD